MKLYTPSSPHFHSNASVTRVMLIVLLGLVPGTLLYIVHFGWGVLINMLFAVTAALIFEAIMLHWRKRPLMPFLTDGSAVVTACLLALSIPPIAPWWTTFVGIFFAIVVAKHLYGGLGYNPFNPAMVGYAILLVSFPKEMTSWLASEDLRETALSFSQSASLIFSGQVAGINIDSITSATPLDYLKTQIAQDNSIIDAMRQSPIFGQLGGTGYEWVNLGFLLGGLFLVYKRIINWHIPAAVLGSLTVIALVFHLINPDQFASPLFHLMTGATLLCAFFIATDPVSAATTPMGRIFYGVGIGILIFVIRNWGGYPDAVAFAVLLMNLTAPTLDYYTKPRVFGHRDEPEDE